MAKATGKARKSRRSAVKPAPGAHKQGTNSRQDRLHTAQIRELIELMVANDLRTLEIVNGELKVSLGRGAPAGSPATAAAEVPAPPPAAAPAVEVEGPVGGGEKLLEIRSPMVGTFYTAASPDSDAYVQAGTRVTGETVVCIVEAMKVMNEIKAECSGTIVEVDVENGQPVEFGQVLFRARP